MNIFMPGFPIYQFVEELAKLPLVKLPVMQMGPSDCIEEWGEGSRSPSLFFRIEQKNLLSPMEGVGSSCEAKTKIRAP